MTNGKENKGLGKEGNGAESAIMKFLMPLAGVAVVMMIIARAPTMIEGFQPLGINLALNSGHVIVFGLPILVIGAYWSWNLARSLPAGIDPGPFRSPISSFILFVLPAVGALFLFVQYSFEFAPDINQCNTFQRLRLFTDFGISPFQPDHCFSMSQETQDKMPWIYPPYQTWAYLVLCLVSVFWSFSAWQTWRRKLEHK